MYLYSFTRKSYINTDKLIPLFTFLYSEVGRNLKSHILLICFIEPRSHKKIKLIDYAIQILIFLKDYGWNKFEYLQY